MTNITSVQLGKNTRKSIREALATGTLTTAIIPLGSTEQHNEHLAMEQDAAGIEYIANQVAERIFPQAIVTPVVSVGSAPHHMHHPGTLSLRPETLILVLHDIVTSLEKHGFQYIVVLNGHGGNVRALGNQLDDIKPSDLTGFLFLSYWDVVEHDFVTKHLEKSAIFPGHAGIFETSFALAAFPENVDMDAEYPESFIKNGEPWVSRDHLLFDESRRSSATIGTQFIQHIVDQLKQRINILYGQDGQENERY